MKCVFHKKKESWKDIPGFEGTHIISTRGRIIALERINRYYSKAHACWIEKRINRRYLRGSIQKDGYVHIELSRGKRFPVHVLVLLTFGPPRPPNTFSRHDPDNDKTHNCIENLKWGTATENNRDKIKHGTITRGSEVNTAKVTEKQVQDIRKKYPPNHKFKRGGMKRLAEKYGMTNGSMRKIIDGKTWRHIP